MKCTPEEKATKKAQILELISTGRTKRYACDAAGISHHTVDSVWCLDDPEFHKSILDLQAKNAEMKHDTYAKLRREVILENKKSRLRKMKEKAQALNERMEKLEAEICQTEVTE